METKVAKNDMTRDRLNRKPRWPAHGHRGFLVQRNHESGGIVIVFSLPERRDSGNRVITTFCNRDIFAVPYQPPRRNVTGNENGNLLPKTGNFPAAKSEPRHGGVGALGLTTFTGGMGECSPLARRFLMTG
jgi:hypothetical protein